MRRLMCRFYRWWRDLGRVHRLHAFCYGLHSNIPLCCVRFFCGARWRMTRSEQLRLSMRGRAFYIQCPTCLYRDLVEELHLCVR